MSDIRKGFEEPFSAMDIHFRIQNEPKDFEVDKPRCSVFAYITSRGLQKRLTDVVGIQGWKMDYREIQIKESFCDTHHYNYKYSKIEDKKSERVNGGVICRIAIKFGDEWIHREGGSDLTRFEPLKGGLSQSEKRAGVPWGIGAYLYDLETMWTITAISKFAPEKYGWKREYKAKTRDTSAVTWWWKIPTLPNWALSKNEKVGPYNTILAEIRKSIPSDQETSKMFWSEVTELYQPEYSLKTIISCRGHEILKKIEGKEFAFQKGKA